MAVSVPIYSGSPPSANFVYPRTSTSGKLSGGDIDFGRRPVGPSKTGAGSKGGLSSLFASGHIKYLPDTNFGHCDFPDASTPTAMASLSCPALLDSVSFSSSCSDRGGEARGSGAMSIPARLSFQPRDRSPVSVLLGYGSRSSSPSPAVVSTESRSLLPAAEQQSSSYRRKSTSLLEQPKGLGSIRGAENWHHSLQPGGFDVRGDFLVSSPYLKSAEGDVAAYVPSTHMLGHAPSTFSTRHMSGGVAFHTDITLERPKDGLRQTRSLPSGGPDKQESWKSLMAAVEQGRDMEMVGGTLLEDSSFVTLPSIDGAELLMHAQKQHAIFSDPLVEKAFRYAARAHVGQVRKSGEPYVTHCLETALILAQSGSDRVVVAAGLLHDTLDDGNSSEEDLCANFNDDLVQLVLGVGRLSKLSQLARDSPAVMTAEDAGRLRTMFLAMVDVRVVLIKLADRIHNLRTLDALPFPKQQRIAKETLEVFAPLANRLGIWSWKAEIEDVCFKFLHPAEHRELASKLEDGLGKAGVLASIAKLDISLKENGVQYLDLSGRPKNLWSVYSKMKKKSRQVNEIFDVRGIRLLVPDEASCYAALDVIRGLWESTGPEHEKDFIRHPKENGYRSLHTVVRGDDGQNVEVQIRTQEMHHQAEYGQASHWRYKEGEAASSAALMQKVDWARWVLTWQAEFIMDTKLRLLPASSELRPPCPFPIHSEDCQFYASSHVTALMETDCDPIYVIVMEDDLMAVQELPSGTTAGEILRMRMEDVSSNLTSAVCPVVNQKPVGDLSLRLHMGDLVELVAEPHSADDFWSSELLPLHAVPLDDWEVLGSGEDMAVAFERERLKSWFSGESKGLSASSSYL